MVEPLSIISGVAAVAQLIKYSIRFIQSASSYPGAFLHSPDTIRALLNDVEGFISVVQSLDPESHVVAHRSLLSSTIDRSITSATLLRGLLQAVSIKDSDPKSVRFKKSLSFQCKAKKISNFMLDIERCKTSLTLHILT